MLELIKNDWIIYVLAFLFVLTLGILIFVLTKKKNKKDLSFKNEVDFYKVPEEKLIQNKVEKEEENELEKVLKKMQEELERREREPIKTFEQEQEEKSIISYQELLQANKMKELALEKEENIDKVQNINKSEEVNRKFKNSDFISPIYGRVSNDYTYPIIKSFREKENNEEIEEAPEIALEKALAEEKESISIPEQIIDINRLSSEIRKSEEFLKALKEFRKNLD